MSALTIESSTMIDGTKTNSSHRRIYSAPSPFSYSIWEDSWEINRAVSPSSSFSSQDTVPISNEADTILNASSKELDNDNVKMNIGILNGVSPPPPLLSGILEEQTQRKGQEQAKATTSQGMTETEYPTPTSPLLRNLQKRHRPSLSLTSLDLNRKPSLSMEANEGNIQPSLVTLPSQTYQVFDDLSVRVSDEVDSPTLPPLDEYFEQKKDHEIEKNTNDCDALNNTVVYDNYDLDADIRKGEKVAVAIHDPNIVEFLVDYCKD